MRLRVVVAYLGLLAAFGTVLLVLADRVVGRFVDARFTPLAGAPNARTVLVRPEFRIPVRTNAAGFRGGPLPGPKAPGVFRIVALGDSFTWGYGVRARQAYPARLAARLDAALRARGRRRRVEVVNLGVPGAGPLDYLWHLEHTGLALHPDLVLVGLFANDVNDLYQLRRFGARSPLFALDELRAGAGARPALWRRAVAAAVPTLWTLAGRARARLAASVAPRDAEAAAAPRADPGAMLDALGARYGRTAALRARYAALAPADRAALDGLLAGRPVGSDVRPVLLLAALVDPDAEADAVLLRSPERRAAFEETGRVLERLIDEARRHGARTTLAVFPAAEQVDRSRWPVLARAGFRLDPAMLTDTTYADGLRAIAARAGAGFVDLVAVFRARGAAGRYFRQDEHWNARGQALAAARLAAAILPEIPDTDG
ncbi:MAG TPA: GDSL-type esterase/lipase family protein [Candidatus Binatia bacterium]|nr:GDSL-type esterase/lipase family protein [Candidatus Binatia bacterium]